MQGENVLYIFLEHAAQIKCQNLPHAAKYKDICNHLIFRRQTRMNLKGQMKTMIFTRELVSNTNI
jgi:hypothetical protein